MQLDTTCSPDSFIPRSERDFLVSLFPVLLVPLSCYVISNSLHSACYTLFTYSALLCWLYGSVWELSALHFDNLGLVGFFFPRDSFHSTLMHWSCLLVFFEDLHLTLAWENSMLLL